MSMTADQYRYQLQALLPPGRLWDALRETGSLADWLLAALAAEFAQVDGRAEALLDEADPRTVYELLAEWERVVGLPDPCVPAGQTVTERRNALVARLASRGGQSRAYFIALAATLGYTITIDEQVDGQPHRWRINTSATTITEFTCESPCIDPLRKWGNELLECVMNRYKPAHTELLFGYV